MHRLSSTFLQVKLFYLMRKTYKFAINDVTFLEVAF